MAKPVPYSFILLLTCGAQQGASSLWKKIDGQYRCTFADKALTWMIGLAADAVKSKLIYDGIDWCRIMATPDRVKQYFHSKRVKPFPKKRKKNGESSAVRGAGWDAYSGRHGKGAFK